MTVQDNRRAWVAALRSGEYQQATGALRDGDKFCCLGVACDVYDKSQWLEVDSLEEDEEARWRYPEVQNSDDMNEYTLPYQVGKWLGLDLPNPAVKIDGDMYAAAALNDSGTSFDEIADAIERTYIDN